MYDFLQQRKILLKQYKDLSKKLPINYMKIHFKSINYKKKDIKTNLFPEEIFRTNDNNHFIKDLDSETKSYLLKNKDFQKYSKTSDNYSKSNKNKKLDLLNKQTIILTKYSKDEDDDELNNNSKINDDDIIYNKDFDKVCEKKRKKYLNNLTERKFFQNNIINIKNDEDSKGNAKNENNRFPKDIMTKNKKGKNLSRSFYCEIVKIKNKKTLDLITDDKNKNKDLKTKTENNDNIKNKDKSNSIKCNNNESNDKNCQTNFVTVKTQQNQSINIKKNLPQNSLTLKSVDISLNLKNSPEKKSINKKEEDRVNHNIIKEIKYTNNSYISYNDEENNISKKTVRNKFLERNNFERSQKINLKTIIPDIKNRIDKKEIKIKIPLFTNNTIIGTILNSSQKEINKNKFDFSLEKIKEDSYYFKNSNNDIKRNKLNLFYMNSDSLKNKENYLLGNNHNFIGKSLKNYQTKNNVFLPNLSERMKKTLSRSERQSKGFILA